MNQTLSTKAKKTFRQEALLRAGARRYWNPPHPLILFSLYLFLHRSPPCRYVCCSDLFGVSLESLRAEGDLYRWLGGTVRLWSNGGERGRLLEPECVARFDFPFRRSPATACDPVGNLLQRRSTFAQWRWAEQRRDVKKTVEMALSPVLGEDTSRRIQLFGVVSRWEELHSWYMVASNFPALVAASLPHRRYGPTPLDTMLADPVAFCLLSSRFTFVSVQTCFRPSG